MISTVEATPDLTATFFQPLQITQDPKDNEAMFVAVKVTASCMPYLVFCKFFKA